MYEEIIKDNIEYDYLIQDRHLDRDRIEEILDLILETVCTKRRTIRIAGDDHPAELVKAKFMKLNSEHICFVLDCMQENTTKIRNIKQYMKLPFSMPRLRLAAITRPLYLTICTAGALSSRQEARAYPITPATRAKAVTNPRRIYDDTENRSFDF